MPDRGPVTAAGIRAAVAARHLSAEDVCRACLERIAQLDPTFKAFISVNPEAALSRARAIDARPGAGPSQPLLGVPVAVKDNMCTAGLETTAGSRILRGFVPPYDATVVARLEAAGAVIVGKTNCDEFAMGSSTEHSAFGASRNPWDATRTPGGSSGGSAVAVAAGYVPIALGSDTGGSVRQPASFCGIVGLKPTYGRVSRYGLVAFASSLDQIGPFGRSAADVALALGAIAGADPADATCAARPVPDYTAALTGEIGALRVGVPVDVLEEGVEPDVAARFGEAIAALRAQGATIDEVALPHAKFGIPVYYLVATAEASANLARYDGVRYGYRAPSDTLSGMYERTRDEGFGPEVKRRIMLGTYALSAGYYDAFYLRAQKGRTLIRQDFDSAFRRVDVIALPTTPTVPFELGARLADPLQMYLADVFTVGAPLAGLPALSVPCGLSGARLPVGLQLIGRPFDEETLLRTADAYERVRPPLDGSAPWQ